MNNLDEPQTKQSRNWLHLAGWVSFGVVSLLLFTLLKLPDDRLKANLDNLIRSFLADKDIEYSAGDTQVSLFFGLSYTIQNISLESRHPLTTAHIDQIQISPSLIALLFGRYSGSFHMQLHPSNEKLPNQVNQEKGSLEGSFSIYRSTISVSFQAKKLNLGKIAILPLLANIQGTAILNGSGVLSGDLNIPSSLEGKVGLHLKQILLNSQTMMGFALPQIHISEGTLEMQIQKATATIQAFQLGKINTTPLTNTEDDIQATLSGDATLAKDWYSSSLNTKLKFALSENILKAFILLDSILGSAKQSDGSYSYLLTGSLLSPTPTPASGNL